MFYPQYYLVTIMKSLSHLRGEIGLVLFKNNIAKSNQCYYGSSHFIHSHKATEKSHVVGVNTILCVAYSYLSHPCSNYPQEPHHSTNLPGHQLWLGIPPYSACIMSSHQTRLLFPRLDLGIQEIWKRNCPSSFQFLVYYLNRQFNFEI